MARTRGWFVNVRPREPAAPSGVFSFGGAWGASEAIGRFVIIVFATPMALVMRVREAVQFQKRALLSREKSYLFFSNHK